MSLKLVKSLWIGFAIALAIKSLVQPESHTLFPCFSSASQHWWSGWSMFDRKVMPHDYRYSPAFAICFTPLAYLPAGLGGLLWSELNLLVLWVSLQKLTKTILPVNWSDRQKGWFLALSLLGTSRSLWPGQCNLLILCAVIWGLAAMQEGRWWRAGLFLTGPIFIKVWPVAATLLCLLQKPRRLWLPMTIWTGVFAGMPYLTKPTVYVTSQYHEWWIALTGPISVRVRSYDAWAVWELISPPVHEKEYVTLQLGMAVMLAVWVMWNRWREESERWQQTCLLWGWTSWQVLFGPGVERLTLGITAPLSTWVLLQAWRCPPTRWMAIFGLALTLLACNVNFERGTWQGAHWMILNPAGMTLLWGAFAINASSDKERMSAD